MGFPDGPLAAPARVGTCALCKAHPGPYFPILSLRGSTIGPGCDRCATAAPGATLLSSQRANPAVCNFKSFRDPPTLQPTRGLDPLLAPEELQGKELFLVKRDHISSPVIWGPQPLRASVSPSVKWDHGDDNNCPPCARDLGGSHSGAAASEPASPGHDLAAGTSGRSGRGHQSAPQQVPG